MKKFIISIFAILAVVSCTVEPIELVKEENLPQTPAAGPIVFDLQAKHPDAGTKAVKTSWEAGDAIFVFFSNVPAPNFLKMSYDGSAWTTAEYEGDTATPGALGLSNGATGTMRAVFLPFGSNATVSASGTSFVFDKSYYAYYFTSTLDYTVVGNRVSGAFEMEVPDNYVQFFVEDADAADEAYSLGCDAVIPVGVASISSDGTVNETTDKTAAHDMPGYAYSGGYLFSGKLTSWGYGTNYYFAKSKADGTERHDYFVTGKTLASHSSVKLPANGDSKWQAVGSDKLVQLTYEGSDPNLWWHTCNYGQSEPETLGACYAFVDANSIPGVTLPSYNQFQAIIANCTWTELYIHGQRGRVVSANNGFLFLPWDGYEGCYWSSSKQVDDPWDLNCRQVQMRLGKLSYEMAVRPVYTEGTLTVHDGTETSSYVPVYGYYADAYLKCEYVMPAAELSVMNGKKIKEMMLYLQTPAGGDWGTFQIFMKEVDNTAISTYSGPSDATVVYEGPLNGRESTMSVTFSTPYEYHGGNLLIGVYQIQPGGYYSAKFFGETVNGACIQGHGGSLNNVSTNQRNFIPKTTFSYASN
ncbi:MAG: hypothetical protein IKX60_04475 [Bacteroidales bacterium]|nr:hypothetical protein [Bacteroidales bacterium]